MPRIDLNCDLGESFGVYQMGVEEHIYPLINSANIACGFHAGDPQVMRRSVNLACQHHVAIGAHPGTPDLVGFGRRRMDLSPEEIENCLIYQIGALEAFTRTCGAQMSHVKPHGWLYNESARDFNLALAVGRAVKTVAPNLTVFGLAGSQLIAAAQELGLSYAREAFIDRTYLSDGSLTPRKADGALITDPGQAAQQALDLVLHGKVRTVEGEEISVQVDTLCIHGDSPGALPMLKEVRSQLEQKGVQLAPFQPAS